MSKIKKFLHLLIPSKKITSNKIDIEKNYLYHQPTLRVRKQYEFRKFRKERRKR